MVFARIPGEVGEEHPGHGMVHRGILAVQGNYRDQRTMADFFRNEFGLSMERGIEEIIDQARQNGGIEGALDPEQVRERLGAMGDSEFLPIPAKVVKIGSLSSAMEFDGDVVDLGEFAEFQFAHMAINAFPILYQSRYREQERHILRDQIERMLEKFALPPGAQEIDAETEEPNLHTFEGDIEAHLLKGILPDLFYASEASPEAVEAERRFRLFMAPHMFPNDVERMMGLVPQVRHGEAAALRQLELLVRKVAALQKEDWHALEVLRKELGEAHG